MTNGSEEGWAAASHDSRRDMKQRDIRATIQKMQAAQAAKQQAWEDKLGDDLIEATAEVVLKGGGNCVGSTAAYRRKFDSVFKGDN